MERIRPHSLPTSRRRLIRRKELATFVVILIVGLQDAIIALISMEIMGRLLMLLLVILR
jgi:hypothetical protein